MTFLNAEKEQIKFLYAERDMHCVNANYSLNEVGFTVHWIDCDENSGEVIDYRLTDSYSLDKGLKARVDEAIKIGETEDNPDIDLYLFVRNTFDSEEVTHLARRL